MREAALVGDGMVGINADAGRDGDAATAAYAAKNAAGAVGGDAAGGTGVDHEPYIGCVVGALGDADITVVAWCAHAGQPRAAAVELAMSSTPGWDRPVMLVWSEEDGWSYGPLTEGGRDGELAYELYLGGSELPEPVVVVSEVQRTVLDGAPGTEGAGFYRCADHRGCCDGAEFAARLAGYSGRDTAVAS